MKLKKPIRWRKQPSEKDYPAAEQFLNLSLSPARAAAVIRKLRRAEVVKFAAKDIVRASETTPELMHVYDWAQQSAEIKKGIELSPLLLVRQPAGPLVIADGYHRLCAVFGVDQDAEIPCKIV